MTFFWLLEITTRRNQSQSVPLKVLLFVRTSPGWVNHWRHPDYSAHWRWNKHIPHRWAERVQRVTSWPRRAFITGSNSSFFFTFSDQCHGLWHSLSVYSNKRTCIDTRTHIQRTRARRRKERKRKRTREKYKQGDLSISSWNTDQLSVKTL